MLQYVCSAIDHSWRQNVVRKKEWHTRRSRVCHWCSYHFLTSSVIYYWTDARQHGIYLFYIITKSFFHFKIFQHNAKAGLCPAFAHFGEDEKKPFDVIYYLYQMKQFHWLPCVTKKCDWSKKITPLSNLTWASLLVEWKHYSESRIELRKCWTNQVSFCHQSSPVSRKAWTLGST